ncbi:MAG: hypothetical protein K6C36_06895 [Clostridia bacterium]|nr:hypothetical protein [Clostridia bacterium]
MAEFNGLPPEEMLPEENPAPAPGVCPPPEEGGVGAADEGGTRREHRAGYARQRSKSALVLAVAGVALCGVIYTAPLKPASAGEPPSAETAAAEPAAEGEAARPTAETEPVVLTAAERLVRIGTWKNSAEDEWVHFNAGGAGWWYDGTYFGRMAWEEDADGKVSYEAAIAYLSPEREYSYDWAPEKEGDTPKSAESSGIIALDAEDDRFTAPGLRFGEGTYIPDDMPIDASSVDAALGKTASELLVGTAWHMIEASDFGIPITFGEDEGEQLYTDMVFVQGMDFLSGVFTLTSRDGCVLVIENWVGNNIGVSQGPTRALAVPFSLSVDEDENESVTACVYVDTETEFWCYTDYRLGDEEFNNLHRLWGADLSGQKTNAVYLLFTEAGLRLAIRSCDWYQNNYTILAMD